MKKLLKNGEKAKRDNDNVTIHAYMDNSTCLHRCHRNFCILIDLLALRLHSFGQSNCTALDQS